MYYLTKLIEIQDRDHTIELSANEFTETNDPVEFLVLGEEPYSYLAIESMAKEKGSDYSGFGATIKLSEIVR